MVAVVRRKYVTILSNRQRRKIIMRAILDEMKELAGIEDIGESGGFDTKMRVSIESLFDQLRGLAKKDGEKYRKEESNTIDGLLRMMRSDPKKFLYSVLEIVGVRGKYNSSKYGGKR